MQRHAVQSADLTPEQVRDALAAVLSRHGVQRALLFGSVARGEPSRHSDVDLIVVQETDKRFLDRYTPILQDLNSALPGHPVEPLIYTPGEFAAMSKTAFLAKVLAESITIYESGKG